MVPRKRLAVVEWWKEERTFAGLKRGEVSNWKERRLLYVYFVVRLVDYLEMKEMACSRWMMYSQFGSVVRGVWWLRGC